MQENQLLIEILGVLSLLVSRRYIGKLIGQVEPYRQQYNDECDLEAPAGDEEQVEFSTSTNGHMISIRKIDLTKTNGYFQGLISHNFKESKAKMEFVFDSEKENANEEILLKFIHYLAGCRDKACVRVDDSRTCAALLSVNIFFD
jgi:hypothetical protein